MKTLLGNVVICMPPVYSNRNDKIRMKPNTLY